MRGMPGLGLVGLCVGALLAGCGGDLEQKRDPFGSPAQTCGERRRLPKDPSAPPPGVMRLIREMTPPSLTTSEDPVYTPEEYDAKIQGPVRARCVITELGRIGECTILESPPGSEKLVRRALPKLRYSPATLRGEPVPVEYLVEFNLNLPSSRPPDEPPRSPGDAVSFKGKGAAPGEEMNRPQRVSGRDPMLSRKAVENCVEGWMIVKCTIDVDGAIKNCRVIQSLPYLEQEVLSALMSRRYTPVLFKGSPVPVDYVFNIRIVQR
jgi:hypothetical protein